MIAGMARLFVAATPPGQVVEALATAVRRARPTAPALRWVDLARSHLTLAFLGSVEDSLRPELAERLGRTARRHPPVEVTLAGAGRFGDRVLWAGVDGELAPLAAGIRRAAEKAGVADQEAGRPLRAHLTLAYARAERRGGPRGAQGHGRPDEPDLGGPPGRVDLRRVIAALGELPPLAWTLDRFELMSSVLGPKPVYTVESTWPLTGR